MKGKKLALCFKAVYYYSEYYINGKLVAGDSDGFLPFELFIDTWHYMGFDFQTEEYARLWYKMERLTVPL